MTYSIHTLCDALKQIFIQLKPQSHPLSFLILTGRDNQGKSTLMRQSNFDHHPIDAEGAHIYSNAQGVIVELGETWIAKTNQPLEIILKQLNRVHRLIKISGILLCVDVNELMMANHGELKHLIKAHAKLLERFGLCLNYPLDAALILTKFDLLPGFCDFYQSEHPLDLAKPLGFSIYDANKPTKIVDLFKTKFDQMVDLLGQQVTAKVHPIRSNIKRTLIREFPLQVASLRNLILPLISSISSKLFRLQSLYLTSGEQGGVIQDRLNKKIQHEFALVVHDQLYQSTNYRAYFIEGALSAFQAETQRQSPKSDPKSRPLILSLSAATCMAFSWIGYQYISSANILNHVSKELQLVNHLNQQDHNDAAIYHLAQATTNLKTLSSGAINMPVLTRLKTNLNHHTHDQLVHRFIPSILQDLEDTISENHQSPATRYTALKIYLMLANHQHYQQTAVIAWFTQHWQSNPKDINKKLALLRQVLDNRSTPITINPQTVTDARNYLNALPANYLYYALAKDQLSQKTFAVDIKGFQLSSPFIPEYLTQSGFQDSIAKLPNIAQKLTEDNWVLERQDGQALLQILQNAYCADYVTWWQHFLHHTHPNHAQNYQDVVTLTHTLRQANSIVALTQIIQAHTRPQSGQNAQLFNHEIAAKFSDLNLLSQSNLSQLTTTLSELEKFSTTLSLVADQGKTAFYLTKARFQGDTLANPISVLYTQAQQFPEPLSTWTNQIADDTWLLLINNSRGYINEQWQQLVFQDYHTHLAHHYPLDATGHDDLSLSDFNRFFAPHGRLNQFLTEYITPFLDTRTAQWQRKELNHYMLPITDDTINELIRANVITHMFFPHLQERSSIKFSLQKINLDPVVAQLQLTLGDTEMVDNQTNNSFTEFLWPESNARLILRSIEGKKFELSESGPWAFFKLLQKVNVLVDEEDSANLQILFEIDGNSGRYLLRAKNQVNPFIPGILSAFELKDTIV